MEFEELINIGIKYYPIIEERQSGRNNVIGIHKDAFDSLSQIERDRYRQLNITDSEYFSFVLLIGFAADEIQSPLRNKKEPNEFIREIIGNLDSFLQKTERTNSKILYRQDKYSDISTFKEGNIVTFPYFLNTSTDNYENSNNIIWVISPLATMSKGHEVYKIYNHGDEYQVTFERNSSFLIEKIEENMGVFYIFCYEK